MTDLRPIEVEVLPEGVRRSRRFWAIDPQELSHQQVAGLECPSTPRHWWVPELGYTLVEGKHLFEDERSCLTALSDFLREKKNAVKRSLSDIEFRLRELEDQP
jgi:hypothetical protein